MASTPPEDLWLFPGDLPLPFQEPPVPLADLVAAAARRLRAVGLKLVAPFEVSLPRAANQPGGLDPAITIGGDLLPAPIDAEEGKGSR